MALSVIGAEPGGLGGLEPPLESKVPHRANTKIWSEPPPPRSHFPGQFLQKFGAYVISRTASYGHALLAIGARSFKYTLKLTKLKY